MRLIKQRIEKRDGSGTATLLPEEPEDMWHAYNLIQAGDLLTASAIRRVVTESSSTGSTTSARVHTRLTLRVKRLDFDVGAAQLHVAGQVSVENDVVKLGSFHTLDLELQRQFTLEKADGWDSVALQVLRHAVDQSRRAEAWAVLLQQDGLANVVLITEHQTIFRQRVEVSLPRKRVGKTSELEKATEKFFDTLLNTLLRHIDLSEPKPLLLASPGFTAGAFQDYIKKTAVQTSNKQLHTLIPQIIVAHSSSGHMHSLAEVLTSKAVTAKLADTKYFRETTLMDSFFTLLRKDDGRAWYGPREVERAVEKGAVGRGGGVLLLSNSLFRSQAVAERKRWVSLVDRVREVEGGEVRILSSLHESGRRLEGLGNVAAILTFPLEDLDESSDDSDAESATAS